ncbi:MAG: RNA polymerase factor sigma-54 [Succinivibrio sp.]|nr:RNA polymerase factor sigma-54 [Succinivibrio sp.]
MRNSLQLRTTQNLAMTPQLQQAIKLLQLSSLELEQEIQEIVDQNPLLEIDDSQRNPREQSLDDMVELRNSKEQGGDHYDIFDNDASITPGEIGGEESRNQISDNAPDPVIPEKDQYSAGLRKKGLSIDNDDIYEGETTETIQDHLLWQLDLSPITGCDRLIGETIIDAVDDSGYLTEPLENILSTVQQSYPETTLDELMPVLKLIQHYDPVGVCSRTVQECLTIQLDSLTTEDPNLDLAKSIVKDHFKLLTNRDFRSLCQKLAIKEQVLKGALDLITSLNPRPGHFAIKEKSDFIIPDVIVKKTDAGFEVQLNPDCMPNVRLNERYRQMASLAQTERDKQFFKSNLQEANWFLQSLDKRNDTLLKVARCIVEHQTEFMEQGEIALHPMVLNDIATEIEMHESTISRVTTEKYMHTPKGTYELKYFFSSSVNTDDGGAASSTAIRARIKELLANENPRKPLSDASIADSLKADGIMVARRTVAKYRESLGIASSSQRKRLI